MHIVKSFRGIVALSMLAAACTPEGGPAGPDRRTVDPAATVAMTTIACGDVVTTNVRLEADLHCVGNGLVVSGSDVTVNLNGHVIDGDGTGVGISVTASTAVVIHGGTVSDFNMGVFVNVSSGLVIKDLEFVANATAMLFQGSSGNSIRNNVVRVSGLRALMMRPTLSGVPSTNNEVVENTLIDNPTGIFLIRQPGNTFKGNTITGSSVAAIDLGFGGASGNLIKGNLLAMSGAGIRFGDGWTDNTILGNSIQLNDCGIQGPYAGNNLQGNTLSGNTADFCP